MSIIELSSGFAAVLSSPALFDAKQSRYELSNQLLDHLFDTRVAENLAASAGNMQEERISENFVNQSNDAVKNATDNPIILSAITQALSQIQSQSSDQ